METNNEVKTAKYHFKSIPGNAQLNIYYDPETTNEDYFVNAVNNYDKLKEDNEALIVALKNLCKIAARETANLIAWDGAIPLDASIDRAKKAIKKAESK